MFHKRILKVKKIYIWGIIGIIAVCTGLILLSFLVEVLDKYGYRGYLILVVFLITSFLYIRYEKEKRSHSQTISEVSDIVSKDYKGKTGLTLNEHKQLVEEHLLNKLDEECWCIKIF